MSLFLSHFNRSLLGEGGGGEGGKVTIQVPSIFILLRLLVLRLLEKDIQRGFDAGSFCSPAERLTIRPNRLILAAPGRLTALGL